MNVHSRRHIMRIAVHCAIPEMILHELGHVIGLWHEHARYDRDAHVFIAWNNVKEEMRYNFDKVSDMRLLAPYDHSSVMHYGHKMFSRNGEAVINLLQSRNSVPHGIHSEPSFYDAMTVNKLYKCADRCGESAVRCDNGGYIGAECHQCACPYLLTGATCETVITDADCGGEIYIGRDLVDVEFPLNSHFLSGPIDCTWLLKVERTTNYRLGETRA